jgi:ribonuclease HI
VVLTDEHGTVLDRANDYIGVATNNTAEYRALLLGLERARELGAREVEVVNDSQLVARQVTGEYRVKKDDLRPLHARALAALRDFDRWSIRSVPREQNEHADDLVNEAIDARGATAQGRRSPKL